MRTLTMITLALAGVLWVGQADAAPQKITDPHAPRALTSSGPVQVQWTDPAQFTEIRHSRNRWESERGNWVQKLAAHLQKSATGQLAAGQTLEVTFTDIELAGDFEPWQGPRLNDVRVLRDIYPPRIALNFTLRNAQGEVIDQGERKLTDLGYLQGLSLPNNQDSLRYEKRMLNDWLRRELSTERATAGL
jgi:hypothetical protein